MIVKDLIKDAVMSQEELDKIFEDMLNTELNLDVPAGYCHKCGRCGDEK